MQTLDVHSHRKRNVLLPDGAQQRAEMYDPVDRVVDDDLLQVLEVQDVRVQVGTCLEKYIIKKLHVHIYLFLLPSLRIFVEGLRTSDKNTLSIP